VTTEERASVVALLREKHELVLAAVNGLNDEQWRFRASEDEWSPLDCVEHLAVIEEFLFGMMQGALARSPDPALKALAAGKDALVLQAIPARRRRVKAPEHVCPSGRWPQPLDTLEQFKAVRGRTIAFAESTDQNLRDFVFPHPFLKELDCYQWLLFLAVHGERHTRQLEEVKQAAGFPT
jgi:hypothetical protein